MGIWFLWKDKPPYIGLYQFIVLSVCFHSAFSIQLFGFRHDDVEKGNFTSGIPSIYSKTNNTIRLFGVGLNSTSARVVLVEEALAVGSWCDDEKDSDPFYLRDATDNSATIIINIDVMQERKYYFCVKGDDAISSHFIHQGTTAWLTIEVVPLPPLEPTSILPLPLQIIIICILLVLSGLFSGLNLGLMSLDPMELQIVMKSGTKSEQKFASVIYPIRKKGNFLLCTLLLGNVLVNNTLTILLGDLTSGVWAIVGSTAGIVVFGEIVPQALCSRYGLNVGARTIWLTKLFMVLTFLVSFPISKVLDWILGKEIGTIYNRKKLLEMLKITDPYNDLATDEVNIIQGALELRTKTVDDVMTPIDGCFMVDISSTLNFETMREIMSTGYTRIPVFDRERTNVVSILFVKDLAFVDPDDCMPLKTVCKFYQHPLNFVFTDITLDKLLEEFKTGTFHMAIVQKVNNEGPGDPFYQVIGIVTLEDVIEEIIKSEIVDETDVYTDNKTKKLNMMRQKIPVDLSLFAEQPGEGKKPVVTPQILLAAHRFLLAEVEPFKVLTEKVLLRLLKQDVVMVINYEETDAKSEKLCIYHKNKASDYFVLILEGHVSVVVGKENLEFQGGPFSFYGVPALLNPVTPPSSTSIRKHARNNSMNRSIPQLAMDAVNDVPLPHSATAPSLKDASHPVPFQPDYALIATTDVKYVKITRKQYLNALRATKMAEAGTLPDEEIEPISADSLIIRNVSSKSSSSVVKVVSSSNNNNHYDEEVHDGKLMKSSTAFNITQSHPDLAPPRKHTPHLRHQNKSMSSGQLMAMAAKYATIAGDRVNPSTLMRSLANSEKSRLHRASLDLESGSAHANDEKSFEMKELCKKSPQSEEGNCDVIKAEERTTLLETKDNKK